MPEGDTVYAAAHRLDAALTGKVLTRSDFRIPSLATVDLRGGRVARVRSRGKHLLIDIISGDEDGVHRTVSIHSHLKMEGVWQVGPRGGRWRRPAYQARVVLGARSDDGTGEVEAVGFDLGVLELLDDPDAALSYLGPDLLGTDWDADEAVARLAAEPQRPIGLALLDQRLLAGVGNVYRSEICFLHRILPTRPVAEVDLPAVVETSHRLLWNNRLRTARTTTGATAPRARLWVYGRDGRLCRRCAAVIERGTLGDAVADAERIVFWCPGCQS